MRRSYLIALIAVAALAVGGAAWWLSRPSYGDIANDCVAALKDRPKGDKRKPAVCDGLKDDDYQALLVSRVLDDLGWTDDEGRFDKNKMLEDTLDDQR